MSKPAIDTIRHSTAHLLAAAVMELYPKTRLGVGPVIENGFFYDMELRDEAGQEVKLSDQDLGKIEKRMRKIAERNVEFRREEMPLEKTIEFFRARGQDFKVELLTDLKTKGTTKIRTEEAQDVDVAKPHLASVYWTGNFVDLCRGPHVTNTKELGAWKLGKIAGAYWRGNEKNKMLTRVYGYAFLAQAELDTFLKMQAEAEARDHKKLGVELDLFTFSELVGAGLPLWTPRGTIMREILDDFVWALRQEAGYQKVEIPHITKKDLYEKSGHWDKFKDELFKIQTREGHIFAMKPMNCPHHTQIYKRKQYSYREMPQRFANTTMVYRDEQSGELSGLARVRAITQDDAHVFCRHGQVKEEILKIWKIVNRFYKAVGFSLRVRLSLHDPKYPEKYLGTSEIWKKAEGELRELVKQEKVPAVEALGEAALYGPKIDFMAKDALGREHQVATIQLDMNLPERFDLTCVNEKGEHERIVMLHAAIMGSIERYLAVIIEHFAGAFPVWLSPVQIQMVPVGKAHIKPAQKLAALFLEAGLRVSVDDADETVGNKIRKAIKSKVPYMLVIGDKELPKSGKWEKSNLMVRGRGKETVKKVAYSKFLKQILTEVEKKK